VDTHQTGVKSELLDPVKARKLAYYSHTARKQGCCLEKEIMQGTMTGARRRGRPHTAWMDNINTWTGLPVEELIRMTEGRDEWRKYVRGVAYPQIEDGYRTEQNTPDYDVRPMRCQTYYYLPNRRTLPPIGWYQITCLLLGDRSTSV